MPSLKNCEKLIAFFFFAQVYGIVRILVKFLDSRLLQEISMQDIHVYGFQDKHDVQDHDEELFLHRCFT